LADEDALLNQTATPHQLMQQILARYGTTITLSSDAALDHAKFSMFSWLLYSNQVLWQSKRIASTLPLHAPRNQNQIQNYQNDTHTSVLMDLQLYARCKQAYTMHI